MAAGRATANQQFLKAYQPKKEKAIKTVDLNGADLDKALAEALGFYFSKTCVPAKDGGPTHAYYSKLDAMLAFVQAALGEEVDQPQPKKEKLMTQRAHPHAWALRLLADGVPIEEFEVKPSSDEDKHWKNADQGFTNWAIKNSEQWRVRRKQKMRRIGEHTFPAPATEVPAIDTKYFLVTLSSVVNYVWLGNISDRTWLERGRLHLTREAAEAHQKALKEGIRGTPV